MYSRYTFIHKFLQYTCFNLAIIFPINSGITMFFKL